MRPSKPTSRTLTWRCVIRLAKFKSGDGWLAVCRRKLFITNICILSQAEEAVQSAIEEFKLQVRRGFAVVWPAAHCDVHTACWLSTNTSLHCLFSAVSGLQP